MKFLLVLLASLLVSAGLYSYFGNKALPAAFQRMEDQQENPFRIPADSVSVVWDKAKTFFLETGKLLSGGSLLENDSVIELPYYNSNKKGDRIRIEKHQSGDSILINCYWWYSRELTESGGREIALFLQKGISRYDY